MYQCLVSTSNSNRGRRQVDKLVASIHLSVSEEVMARPGQNVALQCDTDNVVTKVEWSRPEQEDGYVFFFRDNKLHKQYQDPRYHDRVELTDPEMKNGDASVVLKNVNVNDTGVYKCWVTNPFLNKRHVEEFEHSVHLIVSEGPEKEINDEHHQYGDANDENPEDPRGRVGLGVSLGVVCLVVGAGLVVKCQRAQLKKSEECFC
ncbi:hypothetical protein OYC64_001257 [Pagothenia borchgrevinki]|uniref:Ig-like domain-containing protein n=1 Tax=Pagothenia borchgrevinki TaxID=8213 RepID=A0ABD2GAD9_PAGBO